MKSDNPLHVASFQKTVVIPNNQEVKRKVPEYRPYKRRFKPKRFDRIKFNFEERMGEEERKESFRNNIPWNLSVPGGDFKGKVDESRSHRYALAIPQGNDWKFLLIDNWYAFEAPSQFKGKNTEELEAMVSSFQLLSFFSSFLNEFTFSVALCWSQKKENDKLHGGASSGGGGGGGGGGGKKAGGDEEENGHTDDLLDTLLNDGYHRFPLPSVLFFSLLQPFFLCIFHISGATEIHDDDEERGSKRGKEVRALLQKIKKRKRKRMTNPIQPHPMQCNAISVIFI